MNETHDHDNSIMAKEVQIMMYDLQKKSDDQLKQDFKKTDLLGEGMPWLTDHALFEWESKFFDGRQMKRELVKARRMALQFLKIKSGKASIDLNNKFVKILLLHFQATLYEEMERVATFYSFESVKILSLSYDVLAKIQDLKMQDLEMVQEVLEELTDSMVLTLKVIFFVEKNLVLIQEVFKEYLELFKGVDQTKTFKKFVKNELSVRKSPLRLLVEHMALYKGYTTAMYMIRKIGPEIRKAQEFIEGMEEDSEADFDEFRQGPLLYETREQMREIVDYSKKVNIMLDNKTNYFMLRDNSYWYGMGIKIVELNGVEELLARIDFFFHDRTMSKDDYIKASMKPYENAMEYSYEAEPDQAAGDMLSLWIVLIHTMLYVTNYYGLFITAYIKFTHFPGINTEIASYFVALSPISAAVFIYYYEKAFSRLFFTMHHQSLIILILANLLYFLSSIPSIDSLTMAIIARILYGAGGIRLVSKKYVALMVSKEFRNKYSLILALMGNLGKAIGPGISAVLILIIEKYPMTSGVIRAENIFGLFFLGVWVVFYLILLYGFRSHMRLINRYILKIKKQANLETKKYNNLIQLEARQLRQIATEHEQGKLKRRESDHQNEVLEFPLRPSMCNIS